MRNGRRWLTGVVGVAAAMAAIALFVPVRAAVFGGSWSAQRGQPLIIAYSDSCAAASYRPFIEDAAIQWNRANASADFRHVDDQRQALLQVCSGFDDGPDSDYWGITHLYGLGHHECLDCRYTAARVFLNQSQLDGERPEVKLKTITHELGHVLGLAHPASGDHARQIMRQGWNGYYAPQPQDLANLNAVYPGWSGNLAKPGDGLSFTPLPGISAPGGR